MFVDLFDTFDVRFRSLVDD